MIKKLALYFTIITTTIGITWGAAKYFISKEITDVNQDLKIDTIYSQLKVNEKLTKQILNKVSSIDSIKNSQLTLRSDIKIIAKTFETHILKDQNITKDMLEELKRIYPLINYTDFQQIKFCIATNKY
jgi:hypothetical protein